MTMRRRDLLYYLMFPLVLVGALLQSTVLSHAVIHNVKPDLVLLLVIIGTLLFGIQRSILWAFVGGIALDLFSGGPMGASSLALMAAALVASPGHRTLSRRNFLVPLAAAGLGTLVYALTYLLVLYALDIATAMPFLGGAGLQNVVFRLPLTATMQAVVLPAMIYNMAIMLALTPLLNKVPETQDIGA